MIKKIIMCIMILSMATISFAEDKPAEPKKKTKLDCKLVPPKPQPGPNSITNTTPVKVCREVPVKED